VGTGEKKKKKKKNCGGEGEWVKRRRSDGSCTMSRMGTILMGWLRKDGEEIAKRSGRVEK